MLRLKHSGMEFAVWTFKHASAEPLERAAKPALQGLLMLLDNGKSIEVKLQSSPETFARSLWLRSQLLQHRL